MSVDTNHAGSHRQHKQTCECQRLARVGWPNQDQRREQNRQSKQYRSIFLPNAALLYESEALVTSLPACETNITRPSS